MIGRQDDRSDHEAIGSRVTLHQVEQREEDDPDDVDEVPIEPEELDRSVILETGKPSRGRSSSKR
ncbi:hypothetical protein D8S78_03730 [Natrialba swarupiae]|nr:hypothetical protein [Natrialba swarupiae]